MAYSSDPVQNAINDGIRHGIRVTLEAGALGSCVSLIYSGIDTMAYLGMPNGQDSVVRRDFVQWADGYIKFPCSEKIRGLEFYGARCAVLHQYGVESTLSRQGDIRKIGYMDKSVPEVRFVETVPDTVLVSIPALAQAFFAGVDLYLVDLFASPEKAPVAERRIRTMLNALPAPDSVRTGGAT